MLEAGKDFCSSISKSFHAKSRRRRFLLRSTFLYYRKPSMICVGLIFLHVFVVYTVNGGGRHNRLDQFQLQQQHHQQQQQQKLQQNMKDQTLVDFDRVSTVVHHRKLLQTDNSQTGNQNPAESLSGDATRTEKQLLDVSPITRSESSDAFTDDSGRTCRSGHVQGLGPVCGSLPCLRQLKPETAIIVSRSQSTFEQLPTEILRKIQHSPGRIYSVHYMLLPFVSAMQWSHGIFGSVGEFADKFDKFTSLLSVNVDASSGEKLVVSNAFNRSEDAQSSVEFLSQYEIFTKHMQDFGYDDVQSTPGPSRKLFVHKGTAEDFPRDKLSPSDWNMEQFRLISVDGDQESSALLSSLELAACMLRDGGLLIVDGAETTDPRDTVSRTVTNFLSKQGQSTLSSLLTAGNKIFLTTTNWKNRYAEYIWSNLQLVQTGLALTYSTSGGILFENAK
jgi:hypothetical protein